MRTRTILFLVIISAFLVAGIYSWKEYHRVSKNLNDVVANFNVNADEIIAEFESGNAETEKKYLGKVISVNGKIKQVESDNDKNYTVVLGSSAGMSAIRCSMDSTENEQLKTLKEGQKIIIKGSFTGYQKDETGLLGSDIKLNRAVIQRNKNQQ